MGESERVEGHDSERGRRRGRGVCLRERVNSSEEEEGGGRKEKVLGCWFEFHTENKLLSPGARAVLRDRHVSVMTAIQP